MLIAQDRGLSFQEIIPVESNTTDLPQKLLAYDLNNSCSDRSSEVIGSKIEVVGDSPDELLSMSKEETAKNIIPVTDRVYMSW
ncbi:MAG: hypothetical protein ACK521_03665 [bacterium]